MPKKGKKERNEGSVGAVQGTGVSVGAGKSFARRE